MKDCIDITILIKRDLIVEEFVDLFWVLKKCWKIAYNFDNRSSICKNNLESILILLLHSSFISRFKEMEQKIVITNEKKIRYIKAAKIS